MLATGAVSTRWLVLPRAVRGAAGEGARLGSRTAGAGLAASTLLVPAMALVFVRQLSEFRDPFVPWTEDAHLLLTGTSWGRTYLIALAGVACLPFAFLLARVRPAAWLLAGVLTLALGTFPALTGHASAAGPLRPLTLTTDVLHVWTAGAWIGGLGMVLLLHRASGQGHGREALLTSLIAAFSPVALACVCLLVVTGVIAAWVHLPSPGALLTSTYGRVLVLKVGIVGVVATLGFLNWRRHTPRLGESGGDHRLARAGMAEFWLAQVVLLVTGVLVRTPPP